MINYLFKILTGLLSVCICLLSCITGLGTQQVASLRSIQKLTDSFYTMDYTYDYDIDELLSRGVSSTVDMVIYGAANVLGVDDMLEKGFACTTFNAVTPAGDCILARNFDYTPAPGMLLWTHPEDGYASVSMVGLELLFYGNGFLPDNVFNSLLTLLAPYACVDGMNEKGLCIAVLELETSPTFQLTDRKSLTTTTMIRAVLDKAATVEEAVEIFNTYDMRDFLFSECNYHYQVTDAYGKSVIIEYVNNEINFIYPENRGGAVNYQAAANYYLSEGVKDEKGFGHERVQTAMNALDASRGVMTEGAAMDVLKSVSMEQQDLLGYICDTLWSVVYNSDDLTFTLCAGLDYSTVYKFSVAQPQVKLTEA